MEEQSQSTDEVRHHALRVCKHGEGKKQPPNSFVKMVPGLYTAFIAHLQEALQRGISQPVMRELILQTLVYENTNADFQGALHPTKAAGETLTVYLRTCKLIGSEG